MSDAHTSNRLPFEGTRAQRRAHRPLHAAPSALESTAFRSEAASNLPEATRPLPEPPTALPEATSTIPEATSTYPETTGGRPFPTRAELRAQREKAQAEQAAFEKDLAETPEVDPTSAADTAASEPTEPVSGFRKFALVVREYTMILVIALTISALIRAFLFQAFWIPSGSMKNTLEVGDSVAVSRLTPRFFNIERGDVVVFHDSQNWLSPVATTQSSFYWLTRPLEFLGLRPESSEQFLVKRVIGVPGDKVVCCNSADQLLVNGTAISEPYLAEGSYNTLQPFSVTVPAGKLWVMGDNRNNSADSRAHQDKNGGMVNIEDVVGKVFGVVWPYAHWQNPTNHEPFKEVPNPAAGSK